MSSIDEIKPLLMVAVMLIGLVALLANGAPLPRVASANGADWTREPNGAWQRVDEGAIPPIEYPPGE